MKRAAFFLTLLLPVTLLLAFGYVVNGRVQAKPQLIDVGGIIATDTTWTAANSPYILTDMVTVQTGVTLTIEGGVTVMTPDTGDYLDVQGHLEAVGTAVNPILFTSLNDLPSNNWSSISVFGSANFDHVTMRHAYTALFMAGSSGGVVSLTNSIIEENQVHPIVVTTDALHRLEMNNVTFINNVPNRVGIETGGGNLTLAGSPILGPQPGLEGYEELNTAVPTVFAVPEGITLTLQPGTNLMMLSTVQVAGHLVASGTLAEPVLWQTVPESAGGVFSVIVLPTGTAVFNHTTLKGSPDLGLAVVGESDAPVVIENSTLEAMGNFPLLIEPPSLHRVQMTNLTFLNNAVNRVLVDTEGGQDAIVADVTLTAQPGLGWYEFADASTPQTPPAEVVVPEGITLTVDPGVELRFGDGAETLVVNGRLQAIGTPTQPITFTSEADSGPGQWEGIILQGGSSQLENVVVRNGRENFLIGSLNSTATVHISDSIFSDSLETPLGIQTGNLHQASLNNVTFANNVEGNNIVLYGAATLGGDATLTDQPGLDAYIVLDGNLAHWFAVPPTSTLSINSGVTLKFNDSGGDFGLNVEGALTTAGTQAEPVILTSQRDSAPGEWEGVLLQGGSANLQHTIIRYSEEAILIGDLDASDTVQIANSVLQSNSTSPLGVTAETLHQVSLNNVTFSDNQNGDHIVIYQNGALAGDVTLTTQPGLAGYIVFNSPTSQLIVPDGINLSLEQGAVLKFSGSNHELLVQGHLQTMGTSLQPVILTSLADSAPNQWGGIVIENGTAQLDYAEVRYGEYNVVVNNTAVSTPVLIQNSQIHSAEQVGLWVQDGAVTAVCSRFANTNGSGVLVWNTGNPQVEIISSALVGNADVGLRNDNFVQVDARHNWWGDASGPSGIGPGSGDAVLGSVLFVPWLEEDTCTTVSYQLYLPFVVTP